jgi:hypothetical protein
MQLTIRRASFCRQCDMRTFGNDSLAAFLFIPVIKSRSKCRRMQKISIVKLSGGQEEKPCAFHSPQGSRQAEIFSMNCCGNTLSGNRILTSTSFLTVSVESSASGSTRRRIERIVPSAPSESASFMVVLSSGISVCVCFVAQSITLPADGKCELSLQFLFFTEN